MTSTPSLSVPAASEPAVQARDVNEAGARGYYVVPEKRDGKLPGIVVVHEWWGLNDYIKEEARKLAAQGYAVFAADLYDGEVASSSARAGQLAGEARANPEGSVAKLRADLDYLEKQPEVDANRLADLGWCFGGGMAALLGSSGDTRLKATVVYYGNPITDPAALARMKQPVLGVWGMEDQSVKVDTVRTFEQALKDQGTPVEFHYYEGAGHAFANPTRGDSYRPEATADAWQKTLNFLEKNL